MKYRGIGLLSALATALFLSTAVAWSQETVSVPGLEKTCLFDTIDLSGSDDYQEYQGIISDQLRAELKNAGFELVPREEWDAARERAGLRMQELSKGDSALEVAAAVRADMAVVSFFSVEDTLMALDIKCYDVEQKALITGVFKSVRINLSIYNALAEAVAELVPKIRLLGPPPVSESPVVEEIALLSKDEGMDIYLGDEGFVGKITDGKLLLPPIPFAIGTKISIEKKKEGYHPGEETVKLKKPEMIVSLDPLRKQTRYATEFNWTFGQLLGFGIAERLYLKPDMTYLSAEHYFYVQHNFSGGKPVFHHDIRLLFGGYLLTGPDRFFRINMSAGFGMIVTYFSITDQPMYADFYWDIMNTSFELNFQKYILYFRYEAKYALGLGPMNLLGRSWITVFGDGGPTVFTLGLARKW